MLSLPNLLHALLSLLKVLVELKRAVVVGVAHVKALLRQLISRSSWKAGLPTRPTQLMLKMLRALPQPHVTEAVTANQIVIAVSVRSS